MNADWQTIVALGIVFAAAACVVRWTWLSYVQAGRKGCGTGCGNCSAKGPQAPSLTPLVQVQLGSAQGPRNAS